MNKLVPRDRLCASLLRGHTCTAFTGTASTYDDVDDLWEHENEYNDETTTI